MSSRSASAHRLTRSVVASGVAERVVEAFEVIEVRHDHADLCVLPLGAAQLVLERLFHVTAVEQTRERIADGADAQGLVQAKVRDGEGDLIGDGFGE